MCGALVGRGMNGGDEDEAIELVSSIYRKEIEQ
jgi:hypothetical protein